MMLIVLVGIRLVASSWVPTGRVEKFPLDPAFTSWSCKGLDEVGKEFCVVPGKFNLEHVACRLSLPDRVRPGGPKRKWDCSPSSTVDKTLYLQHTVKCTKSLWIESCQLTTQVSSSTPGISSERTLLEGLVALLILLFLGPGMLVSLAIVGMLTNTGGPSSQASSYSDAWDWDWDSSSVSTSYE